MALDYRKDIDGLRAVAVLSVLIYHCQFLFNNSKVLKGGFLGVDVFFVISGFLITSGIYNSNKKGNFSFKNFYEKRARRLLPALFFVMAITIIYGFFFLNSFALKDLAKSSIATLFFSSNFFFFRQDSYVATPSLYKPLLHTWSLAVEEQFYLTYPVFLFVALKKLSKYIAFLLGSLFIFSFAVFTYFYFINSSMTFYLMPFRGWEMMAGAITWFLSLRTPKKIKVPILADFLIIFVGGGILLFCTEVNPYLPICTFVIVIFSAFIIYFGEKLRLLHSLLSLPPMVYIGLSSYSLYLWHQPILAFMRIYHYGDIPENVKYLVAFISIILSFVTVKFIEKPLRDWKVIGSLKFLIGIIFFGGLLTLTSVLIYKKDGFPASYSPDLQRLQAQIETPEFMKLEQNGSECRSKGKGRPCVFGKGNWVVLGDSHAGVLAPAVLESELGKEGGVTYLAFDQCPFIRGLFFEKKDCLDINPHRFSLLKNLEKNKRVILSVATRQFNDAKDSDLKDINPKIVYQEYGKSIRWLLEEGFEVFVVLPFPYNRIDPKQKLLELKESQNARLFSNADTYSLTEEMRNLILKEIERDDVHLIDPLRLLCEETIGECTLYKNGNFYFTDGNAHLTRFAADIIVQKIIQIHND